MAESKRDLNHVTSLLAVSSTDSVTPVVVEADETTKRLLVDANFSAAGNSAVGDGTTTVTTAGTRVQLASNSCVRVFIQARSDNTDAVVIGGVTCVAAESTRRGVSLLPTQGDWFNVNNTNLLYVDAVTNGDIIHWYFEN